MSQYGTHPEYERGFDDGLAVADSYHDPLIKACRDLLERWGTNKNLSECAQNLKRELDSLAARHAQAHEDQCPFCGSQNGIEAVDEDETILRCRECKEEWEVE